MNNHKSLATTVPIVVAIAFILLDLVTGVFVLLKLAHVIEWKWIWVLSPIGLELAVTMVILISIIVVTMIPPRK